MIGLVIGKAILLFIDWLLSISDSNMLMQRTELNIQTAFGALVILVLAGIISGAFPAAKAAMIEPVDAICYENRG
jgi:ABC-type lipoprotein release transport system permease subunit